MIRLLTWPFRTAFRLTALAWLVGVFWVGAAGMALAADGDGFINTPDLAGGASPTVFEQIPLAAYTLPFGLSDSETEFPYVQEAMWNTFRGLGNILLFIAMALVKGSLAAMQWMLNLTIYRDNAAGIDQAVQSLAASVFFPLLAATLAIAGATMYGRMRREGNGSIFNDAVWVLAASILAVTFALAPSKIAGDLDGIRTSVSDAVMSGYAGSPTADSAAGFAEVAVPDTTEGATRALTDSLWNVYAVAPWCWSAFGDMNICKDVGKDYLTDSDRWKAIAASNVDRAGEEEPSKCADEVQAQCDWVRGQSFGRLGGVLFATLISIPLALMLLALVLFGVMALVGFLLLLLIGPLFLLAWMIPGRPRAIGVRWFEALLGSLLQSIIITALLGAVMVLSGLFNMLLPTYGLFMVGVLNAAGFVMVFKVRGMFENLTGLTSPGGSAAVSSYVTMKMVSALGRATKKLGTATKATAAGTASAAGAGVNQVLDPNSVTNRSVRHAGHKMAQLRQFAAVPTAPASAAPAGAAAAPAGAAAAPGAHATPYRAGAPVPAPARQLPGSGPVRALPGAPVRRRELTPVASSLTTVEGQAPPAGLPAPVQQDTPRVIASASSSRQGPTPDVQRRHIVQPTRRDNLTPPVKPRPADGVVQYGNAPNAHAVTHRMAPLSPRRKEPK